MLDEWIRRIRAAKLPADEAELSGWLELLERAALGEAWAEAELTRIVAFFARNQGAEGRPTSEAITRVLLLEDTVRDLGKHAEVGDFVRKLVHLVADAHEAGVAQRTHARHKTKLSNISPVLRLEGKAVVGFLLGPMEAEILDALFGRVLREAVRLGVDRAVIDCLGAGEEEPLFHRTVAGFLAQPPGNCLRLVLTGLNDPDRTKEQLLEIGADLERLTFADDVSTVLQSL